MFMINIVQNNTQFRVTLINFVIVLYIFMDTHNFKLKTFTNIIPTTVKDTNFDLYIIIVKHV